ncbi:MAG: uncharacterized protein QOD74_1242 [Variibacter sp.]|jgi:hypothetical protein|nr:uncharacterized protein [Variibacter sp.]
MLHWKPAALVGVRRAAALAVVAVAMIGSGALAQQPSAGSMSAARELIEAKGVMTMFDPLIPGVVETVKGTFLRTNTSLSKELNEVAGQLRTEFSTKRAEVLDEFSKAYAEHFSEQELRAILAFYKTPAGKKVITEEPKILDQGMTRVQAWADKLSETVLSRFRAEMKKRGHNL